MKSGMHYDEKVLSQFLRDIESDINAAVQADGIEAGGYHEQAFTHIACEELEAAGVLESPQIHYYASGQGQNMLKANGYSYPDDERRLDLVVTHYVANSTTPSTMTAAEVETSLRKLSRFFIKSFDGLHEKLDPSMDERDMPERIYELREEIKHVNLILITNCVVSIRREIRALPKFRDIKLSFEICDLERLRRLRESGGGYEPIRFNVKELNRGVGLKCVRLEQGNGYYDASLTIFPGDLLSKLYELYGGRLLDMNVRSYLQAKGKINKGILETLRKHPADFMAYNNGITLIADKVEFDSGDDGKEEIIAVEGLQIVNGGQTTASIHRAVSEYSADVSQVAVQAKIVIVDPAKLTEVVPLISRFSNTQNKVTEPDLQSNHSYHVGIERVARREWSPDQKTKWFYERARGSYQTERAREGRTIAQRKTFDSKYPSSQRFTKEELAKFENCWAGLPHWVNLGSQKNFTKYMSTVTATHKSLEENWEPTQQDFRQLVAKAILYRAVYKIVRGNSKITKYQVYITNYTVALLAEKTARRIDLEAIWNRQDIGHALAELAATWASTVFTEFVTYTNSQSAHVDNVIKSEAAWNYIRGINFRVSGEVNNELIKTHPGLSSKQAPIDAADQNNIAFCTELNAEAWLSISRWANSAGDIPSWQKGIATTLASYAAAEWQRKPTAKQAKHAIDIINKARAAGVLSTI